MRALLQRVSGAQVVIEDTGATSQTGAGLVVFVGIGPNDSEEQVAKLWSKIRKLRIFPDDRGMTNLSLADVGGELMVVSQFTLYADCKKGNRPSFAGAGKPDDAERLYNRFVELAHTDGFTVSTGQFGAMMHVALVNEGPFTIWLDTDMF